MSNRNAPDTPLPISPPRLYSSPSLLTTPSTVAFTANPRAISNTTVDSRATSSGLIHVGERAAGILVAVAWAVVFDMDGVVADNEPLALAVYPEVLRRRGIAPPDHGPLAQPGLSWADNLQRLRQRFGITDTLERLLCESQALYLERLRAHLAPRDGFFALFERVACAGYRLGLATSSAAAQVDLTITALGLTGRLAAVVTGADVARPKPDPQGYLLAAARLGLPPAACLAIEDSSTGVRAARAAGLPCIAAPTSSTRHQDFTPASVVVDSLDAITLPLIARLLSNEGR